jgi:two-component system response regulator NreC
LGASRTPPAVRILVVDDHGLVREGLIALLEICPQWQVVGIADTGLEAVRAAGRLRPDLVVMDLILPELPGIDAMERILKRLPQTRFVILSACQTAEHVCRALRSGASAYLSKETATEELVLAVRAVSRGHRYLSARIAAVLADGSDRRCLPRSRLEQLSAREREVLHLVAAGRTSAEIGKQMSLSRTTVDTYRSRLIGKLHLTDRAQLIHFAIEHALAPA